MLPFHLGFGRRWRYCGMRDLALHLLNILDANALIQLAQGSLHSEARSDRKHQSASTRVALHRVRRLSLFDSTNLSVIVLARANTHLCHTSDGRAAHLLEHRDGPLLAKDYAGACNKHHEVWEFKRGGDAHGCAP